MAFTEIKLEKIDALINFINTNKGELVAEDEEAVFAKAAESLINAKELATDNKRMTCLYDAATKYANQLAFRLFAEDKLSDAAAAEFRAFEPAVVVAGYAADYTKAEQEKAAEITRLQEEFMAERRPFEIFQAVISGMTKEEAEAKQAEYLNRQANIQG